MDPVAPRPHLRTPEGWTAGVYANGVGVWFSQNEFTLDFVVNLPNEQVTDAAGHQVVIGPHEVVARVKIPPRLAFEVLKQLNAGLGRYEATHGKIPEFESPGTPPD